MTAEQEARTCMWGIIGCLLSVASILASDWLGLIASVAAGVGGLMAGRATGIVLRNMRL